MMKRLLAQIGIAFFSALAAAFYLPFEMVVVLMGAASVLTVVFFFIRKIRKRIYLPLITLFVAAGCLVQLLFGFFTEAPTVEKYSGEHTVRATVTDEPYRYYNDYCYKLSVFEADGEEARFSLLLRYPDMLDAEAFDELSFDGIFEREELSYYRAKGYFLRESDYKPAITVTHTEKKPLYCYAIRIRQYFRDVTEKLLPENDAALCRAILLGDRYALSQDIGTQFRFAGASYFVVVSGMHFAILTLFLTFLLKKVIRNRFIYLPVVIVFTILYMAVTGFSPSVMRSGVMMLLYTGGQFFRRQVYSLNSLGFAGLLLPFLMSPYCAGDIGLILSFYATFAILQWSGPIYERIRIKTAPEKKEKLYVKAVNRFLGLFSATAAANITVFPISLFVFHAFSSVTLLSAVLLYLEIEAILILTLFVCLLWLIPPLRFLSIALSWGLYGLCELVLLIVRTLSSLPFAYVRVGDFFVYVWVLMTVLLLIAVWLCRNGYRYVIYAALGSLMILLSGCAVSALMPESSALTAYDADDGMFVVFEEEGERWALCCDAGGSRSYEIYRELSDETRQIGAVVCDTHAQRKTLEAVSKREFAISHYLQYDRSKELSEEDDITPFSDACGVRLSDKTYLTLLPAGSACVRYVQSQEFTALIVPDGADLSEVPMAYRTASVAVIGEKTKNAELLSCGTLILSEDKTLSYIEASALTEHYQRAAFTCEGDIQILTE